MTEIEKVYDRFVGQKVGNGQCGALTSDYMLYQTNNKYQWAGESYGGVLPPGVKTANTCWEVYTEADWDSIGFTKINKPSFSQLKAGDTFYVAPRPNLPTGHTGMIASVANGQAVTFEQNVMNKQIVQKLYDENSWSWYGGFDGIVRKKETSNQNNNSGSNPQANKGEIDMYLIQIVDTTGAHKGKWYISNGTHCRYVRTPRMLDNYKNKFGALNLRIDKIYSSELFKEFPENTIIK